MADFNPYPATDGAQQGVDQFVRAYQNGKISDSIVKTNPEFLQSLGMTQEQFGAMSAQDRTQAVSGVITGMTIKAQQAKAAAEAQEYSARAQDYQSQQRLRDAQAAQDAAAGPLIQDFLKGPPRAETGGPTPEQLQAMAGMQSPPEGETMQAPPPTAQERLMYSLGLHPAALGGKAGDQLLSLVNGMGDGTPGGAGTFTQDPVSGKRFFTKKNTTLDSGFDPSVLAANGALTEQVPDANGVMHTLITNQRTGGRTIIPNSDTVPQQKADASAEQEYMRMLYGQGNQQGLVDRVADADAQNAKAKAGELNGAGKPFKPVPDDQYQNMVDDMNSARQRLKEIRDRINTPAKAKTGTAAAAPGTGKYPKAVQDEIDAAQKAIAAGKDPDAVNTRLTARLKKLGYTIGKQ